MVAPEDTVINLADRPELRLHVTAVEQNGDVIANPRRLTFSSSDPTVATVDAKGVVTAKQMGNVEITVTAEHDTTTRTSRVALRVFSQDLANTEGTYDLVGTVEGSRSDTISRVGYTHQMTLRIGPGGPLSGSFKSWTIRGPTSAISAVADTGRVRGFKYLSVISHFELLDTSAYHRTYLMPTHITASRIEGRFMTTMYDGRFDFLDDTWGSFVAVRR